MKKYIPPRVWNMSEEEIKAFSSFNRPTAGKRTDKELPVGDNPLQLYSLGTPNGVKVTILLEELLELGIKEAEYDAFLIDIGREDQFTSGFVSLNPNSKIPALLDKNNGHSIRVFESGAILLYLAEKFQHFIPSEKNKRTETLNWLFWQMASAPYVGGGFGHFYAYAKEKIRYPIDRFTMETKRQLDVLDQQLSRCEYIAGDEYSIADIAIFPWYGALVQGMLYNASEFLAVESYGHIQRWCRKILKRKAVLRGRLVNKSWGDENQQVRERHSADDFLGKDLSF